MGIRGKFILLLGIISLFGLGVIGIASYQLSAKNAMREAREKAKIILNYELASKKFTGKYQRPRSIKIAPKGTFYPYLMSGFASARKVYDLFKQSLPQYLFKQATLSPLQQSNKADSNEVGFIQKFAKNKKLKELSGVVQRLGEKQFFIAKPISVDNKKCLRCHGNPNDAPKEQIYIYGKTNGYNWTLGETVAAFIVYVPISHAMASAKRSASYLFAIGSGSILLTLLILWFFLNRAIVVPIIQLSKKTEEISLGENLEEQIETGRTDELGLLMRGVERLRTSILIFTESEQDDDDL